MKDITKYRAAQKHAMSILSDLNMSVCMGYVLQGQKQCLSLARQLQEMQKALGVKGPQCLPAQEE